MTPLASAFWVSHLPHIVPIVGVFLAVGWGYYKSISAPPDEEKDPERWRSELDARRRSWRSRPIRRGVARRGLMALGPLLAAAATGAVIYGVDLSGSHPGEALAWFHAGIATLGGLLVSYKLAELGATMLRARLVTEKLLDTVLSFVMLVLFVPLLITGALLLIAPSSSSFEAYAHLVISAWWTFLLAVHLRRYLGKSMQSALGRETATAPQPTPVAPR
jgi:hypothetical protein